MIFLLNVLAVIGFSIFSSPSNKAEGLELLLQNETFQNIIFAGDITGAEEFIFQYAMGQVVRNPNINKSELNSEIIHLGVSKIIPKISAIAIIDRLVSASNSLDQINTSGKILEDGLLRKMGIRGKDAPKVTEVSLRWAKGEPQKRDRFDLREERKTLLQGAENEIRHVILRAAGQD